VEGSGSGSGEAAEVAAVVVVPQVDLREVRRVVLDLVDLLLPVADPVVLHLVVPASLVVVTDPLEQTGYLLSPMVPVRVPVLAFWGDSA
jgi:hypothetical protein